MADRTRLQLNADTDTRIGQLPEFIADKLGHDT